MTAGSGSPAREFPTPDYGEDYYATDFGEPYGRTEHWLTTTAGYAERIVADLNPASALDAGCAIGLLVEALRERGVDARGVDISEYAIEQVPEALAPYCRVADLTDPLDREYDLISLIEVIEHIPPAAASDVLKNLCAHTSTLLFSSTPRHLDQPTHLNVRAQEDWSADLAGLGFYRDLTYDATWLTPWSALYRRRRDHSSTDMVRDYDRTVARLIEEVWELRRSAIDLQNRLQDRVHLERHPAEARAEEAEGEVHRLRERLATNEETIRAQRDELMGMEGELGEARAEIVELQPQIAKMGEMAVAHDNYVAVVDDWNALRRSRVIKMARRLLDRYAAIRNSLKI